MRRNQWYCMAMIMLSIVGCEEMEHVLLLKTELESQSEAGVIVKGIVLDIPKSLDIEAFGHCWSDSHSPTVNDSLTVFPFEASNFSGPSFDFSSSITKIVARKTYYVRSYLLGKSGEIEYGNELSVTTGEVRGSWTRLSDHWYPPVISNVLAPKFECGNLISDTTLYSLFPVAGFHQEAIAAFGGTTILSFNYNYTSNCEDPASEIEGGYSTPANPLLRVYDDFQWAAIARAEIYGFVSCTGVVHEGSVYISTSTKSRGEPIYGLLNEYNGGDDEGADFFFSIDIQNGFTIDLPPNPLPKAFATTFTINNKIYIVGGLCEGWDPLTCDEDFAYDISSGEWSAIPKYPGSGQIHPVSFVINGKGYVGTGFKDWKVDSEIDSENYPIRHPSNPTKDMWEFDPATNQWRQLKDFDGPARGGAFSFSVQNYGYIGCGTSSLFSRYFKDFWRYNPQSDSWTALDDFPGGRRFGAVAFGNEKVAAAGFGHTIRDGEPQELFPGGDPQHYPQFRGDTDSGLWIFDPNQN